MFSHAQAIKSRQEKKHPGPLRTEKTEEWGNKDEWFGESKADLTSKVSIICTSWSKLNMMYHVCQMYSKSKHW